MADLPAPRVLDLRPIFGLEARVTTPADTTGGAFVALECSLASGHGSMLHRHPAQEEQYTVLEGTLEIYDGGRWRALRPGTTHVIPPGTVHGFRNHSGASVRFHNVHRPALGFQAHLETLDRLVRSGKVRSAHDIRSVLYMVQSAVRHAPDVPVRPPYWMLRLLAWVGRRLGYRLEDADGRAEQPGR